MSEVFNVGDRVKITGWPVADDPDIVGKDGEIIRDKRPYLLVKLDDAPEWLMTAGLYCLPAELEKL